MPTKEPFPGGCKGAGACKRDRGKNRPPFSQGRHAHISTRGLPMILFGVGNMLSDIYECVNLLGKRVTRIVINAPEQKRRRTKDMETRLRELGEHPSITALDDFLPRPGEDYFIVPTTPKKSELAKFLAARHRLRFARLVHPSAHVSPYATIGQGVFIGAGSMIGAG